MTATMDPPLIDLTDGITPREHEVYTPEHVIDWLRNSGGTLGERTLKCAAADMIEALSASIALQPTTR